MSEEERIEDVIAEMRDHVPYCSDADLARLTAALERERADWYCEYCGCPHCMATEELVTTRRRIAGEEKS